MKPNENQIKMCQRIIDTVTDWQSTNDIRSPSHYNLIDENIDNSNDDEGEFDIAIKAKIIIHLEDLWGLINKIE